MRKFLHDTDNNNINKNHTKIPSIEQAFYVLY